MTIKQIFDEISSEGGTNMKMEILRKYQENSLLKRVLYLAKSKRIKFYIKQIPPYVTSGSPSMTLEQALNALEPLSAREKRGHDGINHLASILSSLSPDDAYIIERVIDKDCKIGMGRTNINKIFPKLIEKTPYMGAKSFSPKLAQSIFEAGSLGYSQLKMDGRYSNTVIHGGEVALESRQGEPTILEGATFIENLRAFPECVLNGELTMDGISRYESNGIIASLIDITKKREERGGSATAKKIAAFEKKHMSFREALERIKLTVWDVISVDEYYDNVSALQYASRFENLGNMIESYGDSGLVTLVENRIVSSYEEAFEHFRESLQLGEEGTVLKSSLGTWKDGKPKWQVKMKLEMDVDLMITGFNYGTGKNSHVISSLMCETSDGKLVTRPTGIKEDMMAYITENQDALLGTVVECKCSGLSQDVDGNYALLHPVFKKLRDDKDTCDSLENVEAIENMAKGLS